MLLQVLALCEHLSQTLHKQPPDAQQLTQGTMLIVPHTSQIAGVL